MTKNNSETITFKIDASNLNEEQIEVLERKLAEETENLINKYEKDKEVYGDLKVTLDEKFGAALKEQENRVDPLTSEQRQKANDFHAKVFNQHLQFSDAFENMTSIETTERFIAALLNGDKTFSYEVKGEKHTIDTETLEEVN